MSGRRRHGPTSKRGPGTQDAGVSALNEAKGSVQEPAPEDGLIATCGRPGAGKIFALKSIIDNRTRPVLIVPIGSAPNDKRIETMLLDQLPAKGMQLADALKSALGGES